MRRSYILEVVQVQRHRMKQRKNAPKIYMLVKAGYESRIVDSPWPHEITEGKQMGQAAGELLMFLGL